MKNFTQKLISAQLPVLDWWALASALNRMASTISMMAILVIGTFLVQKGELGIGDVIAFIGFAGLLIGRLDQMKAFVTQIFEARAKLEDFFVLEDSVREREEPADAGELNNVRGEVEFRDISFNFANSTEGMRNVSFTAKAGQTIAIVGPTGAGKTTLVNLLQRVHEPAGGQILVDGVDISTVTASHCAARSPRCSRMPACSTVRSAKTFASPGRCLAGRRHGRCAGCRR